MSKYTKYRTLIFPVYNGHEKVKVLTSQVELMESLGFKFVWGDNCPNNNPERGFAQWEKQYKGFKIRTLTAPLKKIDLNVLMERVIHQAIYRGQADVKDKIQTIGL